MTQIVVGAAVVHEGRLLAARRTAPAAAAGRWEFPGGKVDPGETEIEALVREVEEELGVTVGVERWLTGEQPVGAYLLHVALCTLERGEPRATEHDELRWLRADELDDVDWLEGDRPFLDELSVVLAQT